VARGAAGQHQSLDQPEPEDASDDRRRKVFVISDPTKLTHFCRGHGEMVHFLLHLGALAAINWTDSEGSTALHYAALHCDPEYVEVTVPPLASVTAH
jgi:hypothetical protein